MLSYLLENIITIQDLKGEKESIEINSAGKI